MTTVIDKPPVKQINNDLHYLDDEEPPTILYGWLVLNGRILAERYENHPRLGSGNNIFTSPIVYLDETMGIAKTRNTNYLLRDKAK